jgi:hypothetical protein
MKNFLSKRYVKSILAWIMLSVSLPLALVVLITIETLTRDYPKWHWWMSTVPLNVFSDAFMPIVVTTIYIFFLPFGIITVPPILSYTFHWNTFQ